MLIEGEKYACEACVRGHRVSTCQHSDRPLQHINRKGRPVSQCPHCRGLRKARASHVACECGSKPHAKEDCHDVREEEVLSDLGAELNGTQSCCCTHGMRCTCAAKRDHSLDPVPELDPAGCIGPLRRTSTKKPRLAKAGSDTTLTVFANGHHKPSHRHNDSAHQLGLPYKIPIPHSVNGNADVARRSVDSLAQTKRKEQARLISASQPDLRLTLGDTVAKASSRASRKRDSLPPLNFSYPLTPSDSYLTSPFFTAGPDRPLLSGGTPGSPTIDWNASDLNFAAACNHLSFSPYDPPALTTSSLGELSDDGDYMSQGTSCQASPLFRPDLHLPPTSSPGPTSMQLPSAAMYSQPQFSEYQQPALSTTSSLLDETEFLDSQQTPEPSQVTQMHFPEQQETDTNSSQLQRQTLQPRARSQDQISQLRATSQGLQTSNASLRPDLSISIVSPARLSTTSLDRLSSPAYGTMAQPRPIPEHESLQQRMSTASPVDFFQEPPSATSSTGWGPSIFERHGFTVHDAQKLAHPEAPFTASHELKYPTVAEDMARHIWIGARSPSISETSFVSQSEVENSAWQR